MTLLSLEAVLACTLVVLAAAPVASASTCQTTSTTWNEEVGCAGDRGTARGIGSGSSKFLVVEWSWGSGTVSSVGRTSGGSIVPGCAALLDSDDADDYPFGVASPSGACSSAAKFTVQVDYY